MLECTTAMYKHTKSLVNGKHILLEYEAKSGVTQFSFNLSVLFGLTLCTQCCQCF